ncbi:MAG: hypothetical protein ACRDS9_25750 [Pseudonocardiaceae bacterium]
MKLTILHNEATDEAGRYTAWVGGYQAGDPMREVFTYESDHTEPLTALAHAWWLFNVGDDPEFSDPPNPVSVDYRQRGLRSLSLGDTVTVSGPGHDPGQDPGTTYACQGAGWAIVPDFDPCTPA